MNAFDLEIDVPFADAASHLAAELAHGRPWQPQDRSIDIRITRLRQKIERDPAQPLVLRTVRGEGYLYDPSIGPG